MNQPADKGRPKWGVIKKKESMCLKENSFLSLTTRMMLA